MTISIKPTASGSTIEQDGSTILTVDGSGNLSTTNNLTVGGTISGDGSSLTGIATGAGTLEAWVNFNGTGTVAIRASGNVSSITDNGSGDYTINFTTAMADANYSMAGSAEVANGSGTQINSLGTLRVSSGTSYSTSSIRVVTNEGALTRVDSNVVSVAIFR